MAADPRFNPGGQTARFGVFEFRMQTRELFKHGHRVRLQEQPGTILRLLLENPGEIVTREGLKQEIWPTNTFVEYEAGLNTAVSKLRSALNDSTTNPVFIERVPKQGYRFVAPVSLAQPSVPALAIVPQPPPIPEGGAPNAEIANPAPSDLPDPPRSKKWIGAIAATFLIMGVGWWVLARTRTDAQQPGVVRYTITLPPNQVLAGETGREVAISADGRSIAYIAVTGDRAQIYAKRMGDEEFRPLPGTQDAADLFFSPDGSSLIFWAKSHLVRMDMGSRNTTLLTTWPQKFGHPSGAWGGDGFVYYGNQVEGTPGVEASLSRVDFSRHAAPLPRKPASAAESLFANQLLPGGQLLTARNLGPTERAVILYSVRDGSEKVLVDQAMGGFYLPTGHLIYAWKGNLLAAPFSLTQMATTGPGVKVISGVANWRWAGVQATMSDTGTLVWVPAPSANRQLFWIDRTGRESPLDLPPSPYDLLALSPKGTRILIARRENSQLQTVWDYDMASGHWTRLMSGDWENTSGAWSPDESKVAVSAIQRGEKFENIYMTPVAEPNPERIAPSPLYQFVQAWSPSTGVVFTSSRGDFAGKDISGLKQGQSVIDLVATRGNDMGGSVSPDGLWLAYSNDLSGKEEIYIKALAGTGTPVQITTGGGTAPLWSPKGGELFYRIGDEIWSSSISEGKLGVSQKLFSGSYTRPSPWNRRYSVTPDGKRFVMMRDVAEPEDLRRIHVVENWSTELARMIPGGR